MEQGSVVAERYELAEPLGHGGMGEVWRGFDRHLDRHVAIKFLRVDALTDADRRDEARRRLRREARATARIRHPGVPVVYDVGTGEDGGLFLVMELVDGLTVADLVSEQERLPVAWAAAIGAQLCAVLTVAHAESLIHRDLKPANLMLGPDGTLKVLDFGIVAVLDPGMETTKLTRAEETPGTPAFLAPEYALTGTASPHSDLYAVGCVLHEMLTGKRVFEAANTYALVARHYHDPPPKLCELRPDVPADLEELVLELLAKRPEERPASAADVYRRLLPYVAALPPLPGATAVAPSPDPMRMYATVVGRIADTALVGPRVPAVTRPGTPPTDAPRPVRVTGDDVESVRRQAAEMVEAGRYTQAVELLDGMVSRAVAGFGEDDPRVLALRFDLADALFLGREFRRAVPELAEAVERFARRAGPDHPLVLERRLQEASCLAGLGRTGQALERLRGLLPNFERVFGHIDERTLDLRREIGRLLAVVGRVDLAWPLLSELLVDLRGMHGDAHPDVEGVRGLLDRIERLRPDT